MATRERKLSIVRKQSTSSPIPLSKDNLITTTTTTTATMDNKNDLSLNENNFEENDLNNKSSTVINLKNTTNNNNKTIATKKLSATNKNVKKLTKKSSQIVAIKLKPKIVNKTNVKQKIVKNNLLNAKIVDNNNKKKLLKNGVKKIRKTKQQQQSPKLSAAITTNVNNESTTTDNDLPPILEPIFNINENQPVKKRVGRPPGSTNKNKRIKLDETTIKKVDGRGGNKLKDTISETLDDVMNDLSYIIKNNDIKKESSDNNFTETTTSKTKKLVTSTTTTGTRKQNSKLIKKENIENRLNKHKLNQIDKKKVIDMLDLNVIDKLKKKLPSTTSATGRRRRHSIEKIPLGENSECTVTLFNNLPRSISPRSKRITKFRQSIDGFNHRRINPYTTRSESPARILRNGKHRKLNLGLLDGLDIVQKRQRRRHFSGSEISKLSGGYESDSSFSDLSSIHGGIENNYENNKNDTDNKINNNNSGPMIEEENVVVVVNDTNLLLNNNNNNSTNNIKNENTTTTDEKINLINKNNDIIMNEDDDENISGSPSLKVPEKSIILDIMKQTFNHIETTSTTNHNKEQNNCSNNNTNNNKDGVVVVVPSSTFYGVKTETTPSATIIETNLDVADDKEIENNEQETEEIIIKTTNEEEDDDDDGDGDESHNNNNNCEEENTSNISKEIVMKEIIDNNVPTTNEVIINDNKIDDSNNDNNNIGDELIKEEINENNSNNIVLLDENIINENHIVDDSIIAEETARKEDILYAVGLQSLKAAEEAKLKQNNNNKEKSLRSNDNNYTGTLKTVIKINREKKKGGRNPLKMTLQKNKSNNNSNNTNNKDGDAVKMEDGYKIMQGASTSNWKHGCQSSDTAGAHRKSHYSNRSNMDGSSEDGEDGTNQEGPTKSLVIPEKASSFSIHPGRLCKDECSYCFGKFGLFDTPCHIAQMKSVDRQDKILAAEKHLNRDSCLCDACYRHVDRKSNTPSYNTKSYKRNSLVAPGPRQDHCHVLNCDRLASNILRRKWIIKMRKSICQVINIDLDNPGLHSIPICDEHYFALEHLMVCAMCKRRLARNHVHYLGPETVDLNAALNSEGIPLTLTDKPVVCKLCKCFATVILKLPEERPENSVNFFTEYKKRLLHFNDIVPMDEAAAEEPISVPSKEKYEKEQIKNKKKKLTKNQIDVVVVQSNNNNNSTATTTTQLLESCDQNRVPSIDSNNQSRSESPSDYMIDYNTLIPSIAMDCGSDTESKKDVTVVIKSKKSSSSTTSSSSSSNATTTTAGAATIVKKIARPETVKEAVEISKTMKLKNDNKNSDIAVQRLGSNPSISVRQLFPNEEDLSLHATIDFGNAKERTPEGWEKCSSTIQYDMETKHLWHELQKPYGNQSSFLRHLILLEKYFRKGDLILSPNASHHSINYSESVQNRLRAYDNIPTTATITTNNGNNQNQQLLIRQDILPQKFHESLSILPYNSKPQKSNSGIITSTNLLQQPLSTTTIINAANIPKNTPLTISQLNNPPLIPTTINSSSTSIGGGVSLSKSKSLGAPPGLISLHPGTNKPMTPLIKLPQSQKIKFPITKNWRPNLMPIDPRRRTERKPSLVQVISGGKPYHITLDDYRKMLEIKKRFELRQRRLREQALANNNSSSSSSNKLMVKCNNNNSLKALVPSRKGLIISKTSSTVTTATITNNNNNNSNRNDIFISNTSNLNELGENSLEKLDQQVEKLEAKFNENKSTTTTTATTTSLVLPKIPKSLTVIPQTVKRNKPSRPTSPVLLITQKSKSISLNKS